MKKLFALPLFAILALPTSASALTWAEFWEPFVEEGHSHHHYHYEYHPPRRRMCEVKVTRRRWVPGFWLGHHEYVEGYWQKETRLKYRPCRRYH